MSDDINVADILPNDKQLCDRTKKWLSTFKKYEAITEDDDSQAVAIDVLCALSDSEFLCEDSDDESVDPDEYEDNRVQDDPDFNVEDVLNQTKPIIAKRKELWSRSGIDRLMDSFCCDKVCTKVDDWLKHNCDYFSSKFHRESNKHCINEIKINEHNIVMERKFDDYSSDTSVDTAKYILSNRKRRKSKVTMTIKQFCYSAQKANLSNTLKNKSPEKFCLDKMIEMCNSVEKTFNKKNRDEHTKKQKLSKRKHHCRKISSSSSQVSSRSEENMPQNKRLSSGSRKPKYASRHKRKSVQLDVSEYESDSDKSGELLPLKNSYKSPRMPKVKNKTRVEFFKDSGIEPSELSSRLKLSNGNNANSRSALNASTQPKAAKNIFPPHSDLNTTNKEVFNSTAMKSQDSMIRCKENFQTVCQGVKKCNDDNSKIDQTLLQSPLKSLHMKNGPTPIVIYTPKQLLPPKSALKARRVTITEKELEETLGVELKKKFLGDRSKFSYECSPNSQLLYIPPDEVVSISSDSETDPLDKLGKSNKGRLVEVVRLSCVNRD